MQSNTKALLFYHILRSVFSLKQSLVTAKWLILLICYCTLDYLILFDMPGKTDHISLFVKYACYLTNLKFSGLISETTT